MPIEHSTNYALSSDAGGSLRGTGLEVGTSEVAINRSFAAAQTDVVVPCSFVGNNLQSCIMLSDRDVTIEVNSGSSPAKTFNLKAGIPLVWGASAGYFTNPFAGISVSNLYVTTVAACRFRARFLI